MKALHSMTLLMALPMLNNVYAQERRPNILFAFGDDFGRYASIYAQIESDNEICKLFKDFGFNRRFPREIGQILFGNPIYFIFRNRS